MASQMVRETFGPVPREEVYRAIDSERNYQDSFVIPTRDYWPTHTLGEFILMAEEYLATAREKWTHHADTPPGQEESLHFIRKVAGICVRCMEQHGAPSREGY